MKPDFTAMSKTQLRTYVLEHRDDEAALHAYLDKLYTEKPNPRVYQPEDNVAEAIAEYLKHKSKEQS